MKILISGALGYMGREVAAQAKSDGIEVACGVDIAPGSEGTAILDSVSIG